jgi:membrane protein
MPDSNRWARAAVDLARELAREWRDDRVGGLAAEIAFFALLGLFPGLLVLAAALGWLEHLVGRELAVQAQEEVTGFLQRILTDEAAGTTEAVERLFETSAPGIFTAGLAVAVWSASRGFAAVVRALDAVYDLDEQRSWVNLRLTALGLAFGTALFLAVILAMLVLGPLLGTGQDVADALGFGTAFATFWDWLRWPAVVALAVGWAATIFHVAPNHHTPWRWDVPGAVLTAVGWVMVSVGFRGYLELATGGNDVLGTLGGAIVVMLWLYLMGIGLLLGGEFNAILAKRWGEPHDHHRRAAGAWWRRQSPGRTQVVDCRPASAWPATQASIRSHQS